MADKVLEVKDLVINFKTDNGILKAVRNVSFDLERGETLCIVGESGSGKSVTSKAIMGILSNNAIVGGGQILYNGENLLEISEEEFHKIRGHKIGMIFQDPLSSLNPIVRIGKQITEATLINNDKLKIKYNELISEELVAYKNSIAKRNILIKAEKEKVDHIERQIANYSEKIEDAIKERKVAISNSAKYIKKVCMEYEKGKVSEFVDKLFTPEFVQFNNRLTDIHTNVVAFINSYQDDDEALKQLVKSLKEELLVAYNGYKAHLLSEINEIKEDLTVKKLKMELKPVKAAASKKIKEITAKYKEISAPLKINLNEAKKVAKVEVKQYEQDVLNESERVIADLKLQLQSAQSDEEKALIKEQIEQEKIACTNKLRITKAEAKRRALEIMKEVGIPQPEKRFKQYPFEFSGGMRQRIVIAIALTATPEILICDEPTTALDVTIQAQILELINRIKAERNLSCIFITHDLGVVANMADRVAVMYAGKIVEYGKAEEVFFDPRHPYTWALLSSIPDVDSKEKLEAIPGTPPNMIYPPQGDAFALRSKYAMAIDFKVQPPYFKLSETHYAATWLLDPRAPKVEMPKIVSERIRIALEEEN